MTPQIQEAIGIAKLFQSDTTSKGTPRKRPWTKLLGLTPEQKNERHRAQMREYHKRNKMSIDSANQIINEQEDAIAELNHKLLDMTDARDMALGKALELVQAIKRIQCANDCTDSWERIKGICQQAIDDFQGK